MKRNDRVKNDGVNTSSKSKLMKNQKRMSKGVFKDNYKAPR